MPFASTPRLSRWPEPSVWTVAGVSCKAVALDVKELLREDDFFLANEVMPAPRV